MLDYLKLAKEKEKDLVQDVSSWVKINSIYDESSVSKTKPFGEGVNNALNFIYNLAVKDGFDAKIIDGYATEITYGNGEELVLVLGHADVVPIDSGWEKDPFGGEIDDSRIYGRGTSDDKGPTLASYYALKIIKELNIPLKRRIRIVVGGNEENGSACLDYYFNEYKGEHPAYGFTPDADFPLIYGEKGILTYKYEGEIFDELIESIDGGVVFNSVPESATVTFKKDVHLEEAFKKYLEKHHLKGEYKVVNDKTVITLIGKAAHAATPYEGVNALTILMKFVSNNIKSPLVNHFGPKLCCYYGKNLGIDFNGDKMGELTMNVGKGHYDGNHYEFYLNIRYPIDINFDQLIKKLNDNKLHQGLILDDQKPLYVDKDSDFIKILMEAYQTITHDYEAKPLTIGGGTYARHTKNTVAFGMDFPRENNDHGLIHSRNEYVRIEDLVKGVAIYTKALVDLANK